MIRYIVTIYNYNIRSTEIDIKSPAHALVTALTLLSEGNPVAKDPRIISRELID